MIDRSIDARILAWTWNDRSIVQCEHLGLDMERSIDCSMRGSWHAYGTIDQSNEGICNGTDSKLDQMDLGTANDPINQRKGSGMGGDVEDPIDRMMKGQMDLDAQSIDATMDVS
jgi:hypothetical protein